MEKDIIEVCTGHFDIVHAMFNISVYIQLQIGVNYTDGIGADVNCDEIADIAFQNYIEKNPLFNIPLSYFKHMYICSDDSWNGNIDDLHNNLIHNINIFPQDNTNYDKFMCCSDKMNISYEGNNYECCVYIKEI